MSIRIHNGFEFTNPDFLSADSLVRAFRPLVRGLQLRHYARYVALRSINFVDSSLLGLNKGKGEDGIRLRGRYVVKPEDSALMTARMELMNRAFESSDKSERDSDIDAYFEIWMIACEGKLLGIANVAHEGWTKSWMRSPGVRPLPYWDNSARPSGVTEREWKERGAWDGIIGGTVCLGRASARRRVPCRFAPACKERSQTRMGQLGQAFRKI